MLSYNFDLSLCYILISEGRGVGGGGEWMLSNKQWVGGPKLLISTAY